MVQVERGWLCVRYKAGWQDGADFYEAPWVDGQEFNKWLEVENYQLRPIFWGRLKRVISLVMWLPDRIMSILGKLCPALPVQEEVR